MTPIQQMFLGAAAPVSKTYIEDVFSNYLYIGDGSARSIVNGLDLSTDGGLVWTKCRNDSYTHELVDTERGVTKVLQSDDNTAEATEAQSVTTFNSNGYSIGTRLWVNSNNDLFSSWSFKKQAGFFDIVTYTGNATTRNISHGLDSVPGAILIKALGSTGDWVVFHRDRGNGGFGKLNTTDTFWTGNDIWDSTTPTSTTFRINGNNSFVNANNIEYVAYVFAGGESTAATATSVKFTVANDGLTIADHADFNVGSGDFTMEMWYRPTVNNVTGKTLGQSNSTWTDGTGPMIEMDGGEAKLYMKDTSNNWIAAGKEMGKTYANQWHHLAVSRTGSSLKGFNNGIQQFEITTSATVMDVTGDFGIGTNASGSGVPSGSISNVRFVKGQGLYTSSFSPSLEPLTTTSQGATASNVKLLCCQGSTLTAATVTPGTITSTNNVNNSWSSDSPFDDPNGFKFGADGDKPVIKCGSWTGDGSTTDVPIDMGFEPQWIMTKNVTTGGGGWNILDNMRGWITGENDTRLEADDNGSESSSFNHSDITATGCVTGTTTSGWNSSDTFIYMAIRRPDGYVGKPVEAGTDVLAMDTGNGNSTIPNFDSGFPVDFALLTTPASALDKYCAARLMGGNEIKTSDSAAKGGASNNTFDSNTGWRKGGAGSTFQSWMFKRAPLFFDCVVYKGTGSLHKVRHNLGQKPEMILVKNLDSNKDWRVYHSGLNSGTNPEQYNLKLNQATFREDSSAMWNDTAPTALDFTVGDYSDVNDEDEMHMAALFGSVAGVCKVGRYTGSASSQTITTGFQPRFVLIKNENYDANILDWLMFDSVRGMGSGDDPVLYLNNGDAQATDKDYISVSSTGFTLEEQSVKSNDDNEFNYIYLAIA